MFNMTVYVPSAGRYSEADINAGPLADIGDQFPVTYVVPEAEAEDYRLTLQHRAGVLPSPAVGIAATRRWIGEVCSTPKFLMLDDDIRFLVRKSEDHWSLRGTEGAECTIMLGLVRDFLDDHAHVGISAREGNNRLGEGTMEQCVGLNTRTLRALAYRREEFLSVEHGRVDVMEDFDVNLQLLRRGLSNCNIGYFAQGQKMTGAPGGCSQYRTHDVQTRSAERLAELHPGFVRLRQKQNKTDRDGFGTRTEVTIYWKKAFESHC